MYVSSNHDIAQSMYYVLGCYILLFEAKEHLEKEYGINQDAWQEVEDGCVWQVTLPEDTYIIEKVPIYVGGVAM